jgi:hypothetical protein
MNFFDGAGWAEALLPRRLFRRVAQLACVVLMVSFAIARQQTSAWLMREGGRHVEKQMEPLLANLTKAIIPSPTVLRLERQSSSR